MKFTPTKRQCKIAEYIHWLLVTRRQRDDAGPPGVCHELESIGRELDIDGAACHTDRHLVRIALDLEHLAHGPTDAAYAASQMLAALERCRPEFFYPNRSPSELVRTARDLERIASGSTADAGAAAAALEAMETRKPGLLKTPDSAVPQLLNFPDVGQSADDAGNWPSPYLSPRTGYHARPSFWLCDAHAKAAAKTA